MSRASSAIAKRKLDPGPDAQAHARSSKKPKHHNNSNDQAGRLPVVQSLLGQTYSSVQPLRQYLLAKLPGTSRLRRKKIASLGLDPHASDATTSLCQHLDAILVCGQGNHDDQKEPDDSTVLAASGSGHYDYCQSKIVDSVIRSIFSTHKSTLPPKHLLCHNIRRTTLAVSGPNQTTNHHVDTLKAHPWPAVLALLGRNGESIMTDLLLDCAIFVPLEGGHGNYYQLSGESSRHLSLPLAPLTPFSGIPIWHVSQLPGSEAAPGQAATATPRLNRKPSEIVLVRSRMMYARAALTGRGNTQTGFRHIHVLNRYPYTNPGSGPENENENENDKNERNCTAVMMHMFPRQFGLHNVFDSVTNHTQTAHKFHDYTLRDDEMHAKYPDWSGRGKVGIPKRLRGEPRRLVRRLQVLHGRCSYAELLRHYCPTSQENGSPRGSSRGSHAAAAPNAGRKLVEAATPPSHVSAYCQAVLSKIIPDDFWGAGQARTHNKAVVMKRIDGFVKLRRFEAMSLHDVAQDLRMAEIPWLAPPGLGGTRCSLSDRQKRSEIFLEFLYYVFDSLLVPLIRSNFYVTESNVHKCRLLYFGHDVWKAVAEPAMAAIKETMFEQVKAPAARRMLESRKLGFSQMRLLPKENGVRPIMNLRRRMLATGSKGGGKRCLGPSINSVVEPVHAMLKLEKSRNPGPLGAAMFSVGEMYQRLKDFGAAIGRLDRRPRLYFAKVDVKAAFDTIPQEAVLRLMVSVADERQKKYTVARHVEVMPGGGPGRRAPTPTPTPTPTSTPTTGQATKRWHSAALSDSDISVPFPRRVEKGLGQAKRNTIFVDTGSGTTHDTVDLFSLMQQHVEQNLVKIGQKFYRQKDGIPQGSVLSAMLCNYFYGDLEARHLGFVGGHGDSLLLRLIDDFLLITTDEGKAAQFVATMHAGVPGYGVSVNATKTLVNFELCVQGRRVARVGEGGGFPYCGTLIDCETLEIRRDDSLGKATATADSLTVDYGRLAGQNFQRKTLKAFRIQSHAMFFDTGHNSERAVLGNIYDAFVGTATKMWAHARCLPRERQPGTVLVTGTIAKSIEAAVTVLAGKSRKAKYPDYEFCIGRTQVAWLGYNAFRDVLVRKQARYVEVISWLDGRIDSMRKDKKSRWLPHVPPRRG